MKVPVTFLKSDPFSDIFIYYPLPKLPYWIRRQNNFRMLDQNNRTIVINFLYFRMPQYYVQLRLMNLEKKTPRVHSYLITQIQIFNILHKFQRLQL